MRVPKNRAMEGMHQALVTRRRFVAATVGGIGGFAAASLAAPSPALAADTVFTDDVYIKGPAPWVDVRALGAAGDGLSDDTAAIQSAVDHLGDAGGVVMFPIGTYKISSTISLQEGTSLVGASGGRDTPGNVVPGSRIDASSMKHSTAFLGPGNNAGARFTDLVIVGPSAPAAGNGNSEVQYFASTAINPGHFARNTHFENLWISGFSNGIVLPFTSDVTLNHVFVDGAKNHGLVVAGGQFLSVFGSHFANAGGTGTERTEANVYLRKLSGEAPENIWFLGCFSDEPANEDAPSVYIRDGVNVVMEGMTVLTSNTNAIGVKIGDGSSSPTRVTLSSVRIEPWEAHSPLWALQINRGATDTALINVSAVVKQGEAISDEGTRTRWINTNDKTKLATGSPRPVGATNEVGSASTLAVSDHVHKGLVKESVQQSTFIGSISNGVRSGFFVARVGGTLQGYDLLSKSNVPISDLAYWSISLQLRSATGAVLANYGLRTTRASGGRAITAFVPWGFDGPLRVEAGQTLSFSAVKTGTPGPIQAAGLSIYWEPD